LIDLSYWPMGTANGRKVSIALGEQGMELHRAGGVDERAKQVLFGETGQR
jgi:hypothetical protein